jgi:hypothetical protein
MAYLEDTDLLLDEERFSNANKVNYVTFIAKITQYVNMW